MNSLSLGVDRPLLWTEDREGRHVVFLAGLVYMVNRARQKVDKTARERQAVLYDVLMICILTVPIFSFAFMALLLVFRS